MPNDWFKIAFFLLTSFFWAYFYVRGSGFVLMLSIFMSFLSLWLIAQKTKGE